MYHDTGWYRCYRTVLTNTGFTDTYRINNKNEMLAGTVLTIIILPAVKCLYFMDKNT